MKKYESFKRNRISEPTPSQSLTTQQQQQQCSCCLIPRSNPPVARRAISTSTLSTPGGAGAAGGAGGRHQSWRCLVEGCWRRCVSSVETKMFWNELYLNHTWFEKCFFHHTSSSPVLVTFFPSFAFAISFWGALILTPPPQLCKASQPLHF